MLTRGLGSQLGMLKSDVHADNGVKLHLGVAVSGWEERPDGVTVLLARGAAACKIGLHAIGSVASDELLMLFHNVTLARVGSLRPT